MSKETYAFFEVRLAAAASPQNVDQEVFLGLLQCFANLAGRATVPGERSEAHNRCRHKRYRLGSAKRKKSKEEVELKSNSRLTWGRFEKSSLKRLQEAEGRMREREKLCKSHTLTDKCKSGGKCQRYKWQAQASRP
ncbi:hypothetical protein E2320_012458 [Naja naja]|nr:hypothetical protein E2320_012458 [Naja naja]